MLEWFIHGPGVDSIFACTLDNIKSLINFFLALSILKLVFIYSDGPSIPARLFVRPCVQSISLFIEILIRIFYVPNFSAFLLLPGFLSMFLNAILHSLGLFWSFTPISMIPLTCPFSPRYISDRSIARSLGSQRALTYSEVGRIWSFHC